MFTIILENNFWRNIHNMRKTYLKASDLELVMNLERKLILFLQKMKKIKYEIIHALPLLLLLPI